MRRAAPNSVKKDINVMCACSHGGHLTEMISLVNALELQHPPVFLTYKGNAEDSLKNSYFIENMGKLSHVPLGLVKIMRIILKEKPDIVISTGAEIGMAAIIISKLLRRSRAVYIECSAQVNQPSASGKIVYPFADLFFVQWKPLLKRYGKKARYRGNLIFGDI